MVDETKKDPDVIKTSPAKRHKLLADIASQLKDKESSDVFEIDNHKYLISTLTADEEVWADTYCNMASSVSAYTSIKVPRLSAAVKQIDGIDVDKLFEFPDDMDEANKKFHTSSQYRRRYWVMNQMMLMLGDLPNKFVNDLWSKYQELVDRRDKVWSELKNSSTRIPGGESKDTSLPEKGSSQVTQMSGI